MGRGARPTSHRLCRAGSAAGHADAGSTGGTDTHQFEKVSAIEFAVQFG